MIVIIIIIIVIIIIIISSSSSSSSSRSSSNYYISIISVYLYDCNIISTPSSQSKIRVFSDPTLGKS